MDGMKIDLIGKEYTYIYLYLSYKLKWLKNPQTCSKIPSWGINKRMKQTKRQMNCTKNSDPLKQTALWDILISCFCSLWSSAIHGVKCISKSWRFWRDACVGLGVRNVTEHHCGCSFIGLPSLKSLR